MDFHGLFIQVAGATKAIRLEIDIKNDNADEPAITKTSANANEYEVNKLYYYEIASPATSGIFTLY
jgi:hypothetical protein